MIYLAIQGMDKAGASVAMRGTEVISAFGKCPNHSGRVTDRAFLLEPNRDVPHIIERIVHDSRRPGINTEHTLRLGEPNVMAADILGKMKEAYAVYGYLKSSAR